MDSFGKKSDFGMTIGQNRDPIAMVHEKPALKLLNMIVGSSWMMLKHCASFHCLLMQKVAKEKITVPSEWWIGIGKSSVLLFQGLVLLQRKTAFIILSNNMDKPSAFSLTRTEFPKLERSPDYKCNISEEHCLCSILESESIQCISAVFHSLKNSLSLQLLSQLWFLQYISMIEILSVLVCDNEN